MTSPTVLPEKNPYLEPHQVPPLKHIALKCKSQHGLLVYHQMGTGKTRTMLGLTFEFPQSPWIVILPDGLQQTWVSEIRKFNELGLKVPVQPMFVPYADDALEKLFTGKLSLKLTSDTIVVLEEAHNFTHFFNKNDNNKVYGITKQLDNVKKVIALTGTPVYNQMSDLRILVNLVAGSAKKVLPVDESTFLKQYFTVNAPTSITQGWLFPLINKSYIALVPWIKTMFMGSPDSPANPAGAAVVAAIMFMVFVKERLDLIPFDYHTPDIDKLHKQIRPYVSFYCYDTQNADFPKTKVEVMNVAYTNDQIDLWLKLCQDVATPEQRASLDYDMQVSDSRDLEKYLSQGRVIGNTTINGVPPPKFMEVKKIIGSARSVVVYSSFLEKGLEAFEKFLGPSYKCEYLMQKQTQTVRDDMLDRFKAGKIQILLLHPALIEGVSIEGATQMHILEPLMTLGATEQVVARVVRFKSHNHLPLAKRIVYIYHWLALPSEYAGIVQRKFHELKIWAIGGYFTWMAKIPQQFPNDTAPDGKLRDRAERSKNFLTRLQAKFMEDSIDRDDFANSGFLSTETIKNIRFPAYKGKAKEEIALYLAMTDSITGVDNRQQHECQPCLTSVPLKSVYPKRVRRATSRSQSRRRSAKRSLTRSSRSRSHSRSRGRGCGRR